MSGQGLIVSDHAVLRYLERVHRVDISGARAAVAGVVRRAVDAAATADMPSDFAVRSGPHRYVVRDGVVVTVLDHDMVFRDPRPEPVAAAGAAPVAAGAAPVVKGAAA